MMAPPCNGRGLSIGGAVAKNMTSRVAEKLLLIGWAGADWQLVRPLMDEGRMPHLRRLVDAGASGSLTSLQPMIGPMAWTSAATGKRPHRHGVHGFVEPTPDGEAVRAAGSTSRTCKALWNILTQNGLRTHCVNWPASHPAEPVNGVCVSDRFALPPQAPAAPWPVARKSVHPPELAAELSALRLRPEEVDGSMLRELVPEAARVDQERDRRLLACAAILASCATAHAVATWCLEHRPWDFAAVWYGGIEQFCDAFLPYHPPKLPGVSDDDFNLYRGVVAAAYQFHDLMLGRLLHLAGHDTTVVLVSDHGYRTATGRVAQPARSVEARLASYGPQGLCVLRGPRVKRGETLEGVTLLDVAPTVLAVLGLPAGGDMDGRAWVEALEDSVEPDRVMSWERVPGDAAQHPPEARVTPAEAAEAVRHLVDLGYVDPGDDGARREVRRVIDDNDFNLARALIDARQPTRAIELLEALVRRRPDCAAYAHTLFEAWYMAGRTADCRRMVEAAWARGERGAAVQLAMGAVELADRRAESALKYLAAAERDDAALPALHVTAGRAYARLRRWELAERAFSTAARRDAGNAAAWHGLATAALALDRNEQAAEHALRAVGLRGDYPEAHYHLGVALARLGRPTDSAAALRRALALRPAMLAAMARLVELYEGPLAETARARQLRRDAQEVMLRRRLARRGSAPAAGASGPPSGAAGIPPGG